jgi:CheY-like chemotaxis protein
MTTEQQHESALNVLQQARDALNRTTLNPTLRELMAELFAKEQADVFAMQALDAAARVLEQQHEEIARLRGGASPDVAVTDITARQPKAAR